MLLEVTGKNNGVVECLSTLLHYSDIPNKFFKGGIPWH